jgi:hypothetical protein
VYQHRSKSRPYALRHLTSVGRPRQSGLPIAKRADIPPSPHFFMRARNRGRLGTFSKQMWPIGRCLRSPRFSQGPGGHRKKSKVAERSAAAAVEFFNFYTFLGNIILAPGDTPIESYSSQNFKSAHSLSPIAIKPWPLASETSRRREVLRHQQPPDVGRFFALVPSALCPAPIGPLPTVPSPLPMSR